MFTLCLEKWGKFQIDMLVEETSELMIELNKLNKLISKLRRSNPDLTPFDLINQLLNQYYETGYESLRQRIIDELADTIIMLSQFYPNFQNDLESWKKYKLERLEERIQSQQL